MGRVFRPKYAWTKADGTRVEKTTDAWYVEYANANGKWIRRKVGTTKEQAQNALRKAEEEVWNEKNGLAVRKPVEMRCSELIDEYLTARQPHVTFRQIDNLRSRLDCLLKSTAIYTVRQITPEAVEEFLVRLSEKGLAARTQNLYLQAVKGMLTWAVRRRILPYNPLDCVMRRPEVGQRRRRRPLSEDEIARLLAAAVDGPLRRKQNVYQNRPRKDGTYKIVPVPPLVEARMREEGDNNALVYRIMIETGLRKSEVRSLAWYDLDLNAGTLTTRPEWEGNKNGKRETLPLPPGLVEALAEWRKKHSSPAHAAVVKVSDRILRCFDDDLVAASLARRIPLDAKGQILPCNLSGKPIRKPARWKVDKTDATGRVVDLHSLRHTYGTRLVATGVDIKTVQTLMRHSSPELTLAIYVHADNSRLKDAVCKLPTISRHVPSSGAERVG